MEKIREMDSYSKGRIIKIYEYQDFSELIDFLKSAKESGKVKDPIYIDEKDLDVGLKTLPSMCGFDTLLDNKDTLLLSATYNDVSMNIFVMHNGEKYTVSVRPNENTIFINTPKGSEIELDDLVPIKKNELADESKKIGASPFQN